MSERAHLAVVRQPPPPPPDEPWRRVDFIEPHDPTTDPDHPQE